MLGDLSMTQVAAAALAAVTSMLLSSQIGIAGSLIGAAAGSVIATVSSQVYKTFFSASAEKLRELHHGDAGASHAVDAGRASSSDADASGPVSRSTMTPHVGVDSIRGGQVLAIRAEREHRKKVQRNAIIVAICSALVVVSLSAIAINVITAGEGVGVKTPTIGFSRSDGDEGSEDTGSGNQVDAVSQDTGSGESTDSGTGTSTQGTGSHADTASQGSSSKSQGASGTQGSSDVQSSGAKQGSSAKDAGSTSVQGDSGSSSKGSEGASGTAAQGTGSTDTGSAASTSE